MQNRGGARHNRLLHVWYGTFLVGIASLLWFLIRTGPKPSRAAYPCQKAALANVSALLGTLALPAALRGARFFLLLIGFAAVAGITGPAVRFFSQPNSTHSGHPGQVVALSLGAQRLTANTGSDIYAVQGTTGADEGFRRLVESMERRGQSFYSLIGRDDVLIIKVNSQWDERGGTNTDLVKAIIESILAHPDGFSGEIVIADNGQAQYGSAGRGGSLDWKSNNAVDTAQSMRKVAELFAARHKVSTVSWDPLTLTRVGEYADGDSRDGYVVDSSASPDTGIIVSYPKFATRYGTRVSFKKGIWNPASGSYDSERLKVINVPVLKSHSIYGVTACVKHYMGVVSDQLSRHTAHRSVGTGGMGTQMAESRFPVLNVLDAIWINAAPGRGPRTTYAQATRTNIIAAARDPVALDYWAAKNILLPAAEKLGYGNTDTLDPDVTRKGAFGDWLRLSMKALQEAGFPVTLDIDRVNITVTSLESFRIE